MSVQESSRGILGLLCRFGSCHAAYLKANPKVRRRFNEAVLKAVYVEDGKIKRAEFTDRVRGSLLTPEFE